MDCKIYIECCFLHPPSDIKIPAIFFLHICFSEVGRRCFLCHIFLLFVIVYFKSHFEFLIGMSRYCQKLDKPWWNLK